MINKDIKDIFYKYTDLPIELIKIILNFCKCSVCNQMAKNTCIYCNNCFCLNCYSPFYGTCICPKCSPELFN